MEFLQILITVHNNLFVLWPPQWRSAVLPRLAAPSENGRIRMEQNNLQYNEGQFAGSGAVPQKQETDSKHS